MRQVRQLMGMPISIDIPGCDDAAVFSAAFDRLAEIDWRFNPFKPDSEVSLHNRGQLATPSREFKQVRKACEAWQSRTDGYFSANYGKGFEPSGYVKGWGIAEAAKRIDRAGYKTYCLGAGGDIMAASQGDKTWRIGIQDPADKAKIIKTLEIKSGAVATSGNYERGEHIIDPKTGRPATYWAGLTVSGPDIITADVLATAAFAAGKEAKQLMSKFPDYRLLALR